MINPYFDQTFFGFFATLLKRTTLFFSGQFNSIASDELQILVLSGVAVSCAIVGTFLILRKMTMMANSLSHTVLLGIVIGFVVFPKQLSTMDESTHSFFNLNTMMIAAVACGLLTACLTQFLTHIARVQEDASIGIVFTTLFALGVILVTLLTKSAHIGTEAIMGNSDALHQDDLKLVYLILGFNVVCFFLFFKEFKITSFDPIFAKVIGISSAFFNYLLMLQASATVVGAFRAVGVLMVLAFITAPPLTARLLTNKLKPLIGLAIGIGVLATLIGIALSRHMLTVYDMPLSTSGLIVCVLSVGFVLVAGVKKLNFQKSVGHESISKL